MWCLVSPNGVEQAAATAQGDGELDQPGCGGVNDIIIEQSKRLTALSRVQTRKGMYKKIQDSM